jgi:hypothetical protein
MTPTGFELEFATTDEDSQIGNPPSAGAAKSGAVWAGFVLSEPDLAKLVEAWPRLPEYVRGAVLALVESATPARKPP